MLAISSFPCDAKALCLLDLAFQFSHTSAANAFALDFPPLLLGAQQFQVTPGRLLLFLQAGKRPFELDALGLVRYGRPLGHEAAKGGD
ncbi:hypothetical protein [Streptomyces fractus]|uniref:hypothetical protein n=1 Tax=Streptomyces fractus TaxID=641806 RepID=UPI003CF8545C